MSDQEGTIREDNKGNQVILKDGRWQKIIARNPQTLEPVTSYEEVFAGETPSTALQDVMGGLAAFSEGGLLGFGGETARTASLLPGSGTPTQMESAFESVRQPFAEQNPLTNVGLEIAGTLANPLTRNFGATMARARPLLGSMATGGAFGALFGAGKAQEGERLEGAAIGGGLGTALGPLGYGVQLGAQKLLPAVGQGLGRLRALVSPKLSMAAQQAEDIIRPYMQRSFETPAQAMQQARAVGPQGTLMDLSPEMAGLASAMEVKGIGGFKRAAKNFFETRSKQGMDRLDRGIKKVFGRRAEGSAIAESIADKATQAGKLFDAAKAQSVPEQTMSEFINSIDDQIRLNENTSFVGPLNRLKRSLFTGKNEAIKTSVEQLHRSRMDIADAASEAFRKGQMEKWRMLKELRNQFDSVLPPEYSSAMKLSAEKNQINEAIEYGEKFFSPGGTHDFLEWIVDATDAQKNAYMMGLLRSAKEKMGNITQGGKVSRLFNKPNIREKLSALLGDKTDDFIGQVERENIYKATENYVLGNSFTAARQEAVKLFDAVSNSAEQISPTSKGEVFRGLLDSIINTVRIDKTISPKVAKALENTLLKKGITEETIEMLMRTPVRDKFRMLMSDLSPYAGTAGSTAGALVYPSVKQ